MSVKGFVCMKRIEIFEAELKLMNKIWSDGSIKAIDLANFATAQYGWKKCTTYSILRPMIEKGLVQRQEPNYTLVPIVTKEQAVIWELQSIADKLFDGDVHSLLSSSGFKNFSKN